MSYVIRVNRQCTPARTSGTLPCTRMGLELCTCWFQGDVLPIHIPSPILTPWSTIPPSASEEMSQTLPDVSYHVQNRLPFILVLSQVNPLHSSQLLSWGYIVVISSHLRLVLPCGVLPSGLPQHFHKSYCIYWNVDKTRCANTRRSFHALFSGLFKCILILKVKVHPITGHKGPESE